MLEPLRSPGDLDRQAERYRVEGYAIISSDGMIADAGSAFPNVLIFEADKDIMSGSSTESTRWLTPEKLLAEKRVYLGRNSAPTPLLTNWSV